ncbi:uncharacterized protein At2g34460, chloroplastic-like [Magnolia sinica]|uniref:uncharacterized protein At2g34460, chloroplastic-like n=1 Tax=Magnolia sinica TaxID=86752 RepID=UPI002657EB82|nr:uncharacterized protein At2g34460, chloroplastic-like [Magnolia sinica]
MRSSASCKIEGSGQVHMVFQLVLATDALLQPEFGTKVTPNYTNLFTLSTIVDNFGTVNLVDACQKIGVNRFILISSILMNGATMGQILNPAYIILNVFGLTLIPIRRSGINYTIVTPGGLKNDPPSGNIVMEFEYTLYEGSISRVQVAEVSVEALLYPESHYKVVEMVSRTEAPKRSFEDLFGAIRQE